MSHAAIQSPRVEATPAQPPTPPHPNLGPDRGACPWLWTLWPMAGAQRSGHITGCPDLSYLVMCSEQSQNLLGTFPLPAAWAFPSQLRFAP